MLEIAGNWITLVKAAFYASLACFGAGIAGIIGALFEIQILLWLCALRFTVARRTY